MKYYSNDRGALALQNLKELYKNGQIQNVSTDHQFQPASLDLTLSSEVYKVPGTLLPTRSENVRDILAVLDQDAEEFSLEEPLEIGQTYLARLNETISLPSDVYGYANPKSSTGRLDVHVRLVANAVPRFDGVTKGYSGELWLSIIPKSFKVKLKLGLSLSQLRLFNADTRLREFEFESLNELDPIVWDQHSGKAIPSSEVNDFDGDGSVILSLDLGNSVGFEARDTDEVVDMSEKNHDPETFFKRIEPRNGLLYLQKSKFYILSTYEAIRIPPNLAAEIVPMDERCGEFRSHYAGFFDPGWGWGKEGEGCGDTATLEVRPFENIIIRHKDPVCRFRFERTVDIPNITYGSGDRNNYGGQKGAKLSKHFLPWKE